MACILLFSFFSIGLDRVTIFSQFQKQTENTKTAAQESAQKLAKYPKSHNRQKCFPQLQKSHLKQKSHQKASYNPKCIIKTMTAYST